jgi:hypothetical protein
MGLDALDLVFRLEKRLGVKISQAEGMAVLFNTAGTIHRYLVAKVQSEYRQAPHVEPLLTEVSGAVGRIIGRWKPRFSPNLNRCFPPATRAASWQALQKELGISLPELEQPPDQGFPEVPRHCESLISLTYWIAEHHPERTEWSSVDCGQTGKMAARQWTEDEVWVILCECICGALGIRPEEVTYDARMVEDLGIN